MVFKIKRRKLALDFVFEGEIEGRRFVGLAMTQHGFRFARIVVAVVIKENDFAADFALQPPRGLDFGKQKAFREKPAGLLAKTNDGEVMTRAVGLVSSSPPRTACKIEAENHARRAADERIPEIGNGKIEIEDEDERLRRQRRPKNGRAADAPDKKCHDKKAEHHAVKNGAQNVHGLDQIFRRDVRKVRRQSRRTPKKL